MGEKADRDINMTIFLYIFNTLCSSGQSALGKKYAMNGGSSSVFNINKATSGIITFFIFGLISGMCFHSPTLFMGGLYGIFLCISMHTGFKALALGPMAITSIIASFSLIIPFIFGIFVLDEKISVYGIIGIILLLSSIVILNAKKESNFSFKWLLYALMTLVTNGICSIIQKCHQIYYPKQYRIEFMLSALCVVLGILQFTNKNSEKFNLNAYGFSAGILEGLSGYIVLYLAGSENASVLFPVVSVIKVITVWIIGRVLFKEKLKALQLFGLLLGVLSIILLKI